ncbi:MAG: hypothetical protein F4126_14005 [Acidimicrobiaceae bacterium]|nr:hypothetical protein [Acidimicrobiaceae bacterium]MYH94812.1 hypothetical protein [Acidimicrobiaceae bacterium]
MHTGHRFLPYFSRLDDGLVVERKHPAGATLAAGSAQARGTHQDPLLSDLASHALDLPAGGAVMAAATGATTTVDPPSSGVMAMIGLRCPPETVAVAATTQCETLWPDGCRRSGVLAWSLDRRHNSSALFREQPGRGAETLTAVAGTLLDAGLRSLGQDTPPCPSPAVWFPDGVFLHRVSRLLDRRGGMCTRRPLSWDGLSRLYPLNGSAEPLTPGMTLLLRQDFHERNTWSSLRLGVVDQPAAAPAILPGLTPGIAEWLDDGSFARWVLSRLPDPPSTLDWLCGRLDGGLASDLHLALGEVNGPRPRRRRGHIRA